MTRPVFFVLCALLWSQCAAQLSTTQQLDSLSDESLLELFDKFQHDSIQAERVARVYLERARADQDTIKMARAYDRLARIYNPKKNLIYADSVITLTSSLKNKTYPCQGFALKGSIYYQEANYVDAIDSFIEALTYAEENENVIYQVFLRSAIISTKLIWGDPKDGLRLANEYLIEIEKINYKDVYKDFIRETYISDDDEYLEKYYDDYLTGIDLVVAANTMLGNYEVALDYSKKAIELTLKLNRDREYFNFISRTGEILFFQEKFGQAIDSLHKSLPHRRTEISKLNTYYYLGLSKVALNDSLNGFKYLIKADSIYNENGEILPTQIKLFSILYEFARKHGDFSKQYEYVNKLLTTDSMFQRNFRYVDSKISTGYEIPALIREKQSLISHLEEKSVRYKKRNGLLLIIAALSLIFLFYYYQKQRKYRRIYLNLTKNNSRSTGSNSGYQKEIPREVINRIMEELKDFENQNNFLNCQVSLNSLAQSLKTNPKYLSHVINLQKGKNFSQYINSLRTEYAFNRLRNDSKLRKYTVKAIAAECGFNRAESFSKAFYQQYGIYPSYYVKQLEKEGED